MGSSEVESQDGDDTVITVRVGRRPHHSILHAHGHAEEDLGFLSSLDEELGDLHRAFKTLTLTPAEVSIPLRAKDVAFNVVAAAWGELERALPGGAVQEFLALLPHHSYTFVVDDGILARGSRPDKGKLRNLADRGGYRTTVNLCKEMVDGDTELIEEAELSNVMQTLHIPIMDNWQPKVHQILRFLDFVSSEDNPVYVHCEAGVGRTGIMVACYRMAVMGWDPQNAKREAENFGCSVPEQQEFIEEFSAMFPLKSHVRATDYPLRPIGSADPQDTSVLLKNLGDDQYADTAGPRAT